MLNFKNISREKKIVIAIIVIGIFLRFWRVAENFEFMMDEERDALIFARVFKSWHIPLIGGSIPGGLYVGPIFTWISSTLLFLFKYDYSKLGFVSAFVSSFSLLFLYISVKKIFNEKIAIYSLIVYSFSYLIVEFNKRYWPPTFAPSFFIFILYAISIYPSSLPRPSVAFSEGGSFPRKRESIVPFLVICLSLIVGLQSDPSNAAIFIAVLAYFAFVLKRKKDALKIFLAIVVSHLPLFLFEIRHGFFLSNAIFKFFSPNIGKGIEHFFSLQKLLSEIAKVLSRIIYVGTPNDIAVQFPPEPALLAIRNNIPSLWLFLSLVVFFLGVTFLIRKQEIKRKFIIVFLGVVFVGIAFYNYFFPGYTYEWFFTVTLPALVICFALTLEKLKKEFTIFILCLFSILNISAVIFGTNSYSYDKKMELLKWAKSEIKNEKYSLVSLGGVYVYSGYRYLADQIDFSPVKSYMDSYFEWLYKVPSEEKHPEKILVVINYSEFEQERFWDKYRLFSAHKISSKVIYPIEGMIVDNSSGWLNKTNYDYFK